jgi:hypothetical protein
MAYSILQHLSGGVLTSAVGGGTSNLGWTSTPTNGNVLLVAYTFRGNATTTGDPGWTKGPTITNGTTCQTEIWWRVASGDTTASSPNVVISASTSYIQQEAEVAGFTGTATFDQSGTAIGTGVNTVNPVTSAGVTGASDFVFGCCGNREGNTSGVTFTASAALGVGAVFGADIDTNNPAKNGEGMRDAWETAGGVGTTPGIGFGTSVATNTTLAACVIAFKDVAAAAAPILNYARSPN